MYKSKEPQLLQQVRPRPLRQLPARAAATTPPLRAATLTATVPATAATNPHAANIIALIMDSNTDYNQI